MSKLKEKWKQIGKRQKAIIIIPVCCLLIAAICTGGIFIAFHKGEDSATDVAKEDLEALGVSATEDMEDVVTADGSLVYGTTAQYFDISIPDSGRSTAYLQVVEVSVESGDTVTEGQELYKLTDDSVTSVRTLLEKELSDAESSLNEVQMDYDEQSLEAKYTYIDNSGMEETELAEYEEKVDEINKTVESALEEYQNALDITESYPDQIADLTTKLADLQTTFEQSQAKLQSEQEAVQSAQSTYDAKYDSYCQALANLKSIASTYKYLLEYTGQDTSVVKNIELSTYDSSSNSEISNVKPDSTVSSNTSLDTLLTLIKTQYENCLTTYSSAKKEFDSAAKTYEQVQSSQKSIEESNEQLSSQLKEAEQNLSQYKSDLSDAQSNLATLKTAYEAAKLQSESDLLDAQNSYDVNVLTYSNAKYDYDKTIASLDSTLQEAKDAVDEAQDNLDAFEALAGDGVINASQDGTISSLAYEADDYISSGALLYYINSNDLTVTVSIAQEDISLVNVGDEAVVYVSGTGVYTGTVQKVASESESESVSNVTYDVTVAVEEGSGLSGGSDVSVYFNMSVDSMQTGGMNKGSQPTE